LGKGDCTYIDAKYQKKIEPPLEFTKRASSAECCYELPVFWSDDNDDYHHDKSSWIVFCDKSIQSVVITLESNNCGWSTIATLTNSDLGNIYPLGFIDNRFEQKAVGYELDWNLVYATHGEGEYRLKFAQSYNLGVNQAEFSLSWVLKKWHPRLADKTVRIEWNSNGEQGWFNKRRVDFLGKDFYGQIRIPKTIFGQPKDSLEQEFVRYQNGADEFKSRTITERYTLEIIKAPAFLHKYFQISVRSAYKFKITDYNLGNSDVYKDYECVFISGSEPQWQLWTDKATVVYELEEYIKNKRIYT